MYTLSIAKQMWFEETPMGATLHYRSTDGPDAILFKVGISFISLLDCNREVNSKACLWTIKDGSLSVFGDPEQLTLTFCAVNGEFYQAGCSLYGEELKAFRYAINALAFRPVLQLN